MDGKSDPSVFAYIIISDNFRFFCFVNAITQTDKSQFRRSCAGFP